MVTSTADNIFPPGSGGSQNPTSSIPVIAAGKTP